MFRDARDLGCNRDRIGIADDSAGGNLAAVTALRLRGSASRAGRGASSRFIESVSPMIPNFVAQYTDSPA
jgi:acetyl esterase/lipase